MSEGGGVRREINNNDDFSTIIHQTKPGDALTASPTQRGMYVVSKVRRIFQKCVLCAVGRGDVAKKCLVNFNVQSVASIAF